MKFPKKFARACIASLLAAVLVPFKAFAYDSTRTEAYSYFGKDLVTAAPQAYLFDKELTAESIGIAGTCEFADIKFCLDQFYLLDKAGNRLLIVSPDGKLLHTFGEGLGLAAPEGLFVSEAGDIYIADTGNARIVKLDQAGRVLAEVAAPDAKETLSDAAFAPVKIVVDRAERMYVLSRDETNGIYQLGLDGSFYGFYGSVPVVPSLAELFWRAFSTKEQLAKMLLFIPTEYSGIDIDSEGFVYTTVSTNSDSEMLSFLSSTSKQLAPIRRLNPKGGDVLLRNGNIPPMGDALFETAKSRETMASKLTEIAVRQNGIYSVLDNTRCRVFTYNRDGELLYEFGKKGDAVSDLGEPEALCYYHDNIAVLDVKSRSVKLYTETAYARAVKQAVVLEASGDYETASAAWNDVLRQNTGCQIAYCGKARQALRDNDYPTAMKLFRFADDKEGYSKAFSLYRKELGALLTGPVIVGILLLVLLFVLKKRLSRGRTPKEKKESVIRSLLQKVRYGFYMMRHPFDGFWDMSFENRGSVGGATCILAAVVLCNVLAQIWSGYLVSGHAAKGENLLVSGLAGVIVPVVLWCTANWSVTSLMNGSGNMKRIYMYTCYSLTPLLIGMPLLILISNVISLGEMPLYGILNMVMFVWLAFLLFAGTSVVHQYSAGKTLLAIFVIFIAIAVILFLFLLCVTILQQMTEFIGNLMEEIKLRT